MPRNSPATTQNDSELGGNETDPRPQLTKIANPSEDFDKKLYTENDPGPQSTKKPVVVETYNEILFPDPPEDFFSRIQNHSAVVVPWLPATFSCLLDLHELKRGETKIHPLSQWFINFFEADELLILTAARHRVQAHIVKLRRQLSVMDELPLTFKLDSD